jgi:hypothetical protein
MAGNQTQMVQRFFSLTFFHFPLTFPVYICFNLFTYVSTLTPLNSRKALNSITNQIMHKDSVQYMLYALLYFY